MPVIRIDLIDRTTQRCNKFHLRQHALYPLRNAGKREVAYREFTDGSFSIRPAEMCSVVVEALLGVSEFPKFCLLHGRHEDVRMFAETIGQPGGTRLWG